jgi:hypothetical protein
LWHEIKEKNNAYTNTISSTQLQIKNSGVESSVKLLKDWMVPTLAGDDTSVCLLNDAD